MESQRLMNRNGDDAGPSKNHCENADGCFSFNGETQTQTVAVPYGYCAVVRSGCTSDTNRRGVTGTGLERVARIGMGVAAVLVVAFGSISMLHSSWSPRIARGSRISDSQLVAMLSPVPANETANAYTPVPTGPTAQQSFSPFFEHVLEWKRVTGIDASEPIASNHYKGAIEFCSDPKKELYGYGPVGNCVPGRAAPLIRMKPKRFYHLTLVNNAHIDTNLHTHGLHVSGVGTVDDVTRVAKPGECLTYDYYILDDADVGTFWYHPHRHPLVTRSAFGGAYGMLIVDETTAVEATEHHKRYYPKHLANFLTENEILLQFSSMYNKLLKNPFRSNRVNGQKHLDLFISPDTYYYVRVSSVVYAESVNYVEFDPPDACEVAVVAYDGVYRSEIPGPPTLQSHKHMMTVSSRADFSVRCSKDANIHFHQGKFTDLSEMVKIHVGSRASEESDWFEVLTRVSLPPTLPSSPYWEMEPETHWKPRRPYYMPDLSDPSNIVDEKWRVSMDDYYVNGTKGASVNQHTWDPDKSIRTFDLGQLVEYPIVLSQSHPYHAHINRMQIVEPGGCGGRFEEGEYFDTIVQSKDKPECRIRTKFFDFAGRVVIHCHRFGHEDQGMMTWIDVLGGHGHGMKAGPAISCAAVL